MAKVGITIELPLAIKRRVAVAAEERDTSMSRVVLDAFTRYGGALTHDDLLALAPLMRGIRDMKTLAGDDDDNEVQLYIPEETAEAIDLQAERLQVDADVLVAACCERALC